MRDIDRLWEDVEQGANQAAQQINNFSSVTQNSVTQMNNLGTELHQATTQANNLSDAGNDAGSNLNDAGTVGVNAGDSIASSFKKAAGILATLFAFDQIKDLLVDTTNGFIEFDDALRKAGAIAGATE